MELQKEKQKIDRAIDLFANVMKAVMHKQAEKKKTGWDELDSKPEVESHCIGKLLEKANHIAEGDYCFAVDVANYAMMFWYEAFGKEKIEGG